MTDAQWVILEPLLPPPGNTTSKGGRPEKHPRRLVLDAIFYLVRVVSPGRNCRATSRRTRVSTTCSGDGRAPARDSASVTLRDLVRVREDRDPLPTAADIDSQSVRAADTVPRHSRGFDGGKSLMAKAVRSWPILWRSMTSSSAVCIGQQTGFPL
jgi:transposase